jgi:hypothetical protein
LPAGWHLGHRRRRNPERSTTSTRAYEMMRELINIEPDGKKKEFVLYSVMKGRD